jgi:hypothetical protein
MTRKRARAAIAAGAVEAKREKRAGSAGAPAHGTTNPCIIICRLAASTCGTSFHGARQ